MQQQKPNDPFNWPFPQRNELMYLSTIGGPQKRTRAISYDYKNEEVVKKTYLNKETFANRCDDIAGTKPLPLFRKQLAEKEEIEGTKPSILKFKTNRQSNPINRDYKLATALPAPEYEMRNFIKNTLDIRDIEGSKAKKDPWYNKIRNIDPYTEVEGSHPKPVKVIRDFSDKLNVTDINLKQQMKTRECNPLEPKYHWLSNDSNNYNYGEVEGSKPIRKHRDLNKDKSLSLDTKQISGAQTGSLRGKLIMGDIRKDYRAINQIIDIPGAGVGSLKKGIQTKRAVNPLNPTYLMPGSLQK